MQMYEHWHWSWERDYNPNLTLNFHYVKEVGRHWENFQNIGSQDLLVLELSQEDFCFTKNLGNVLSTLSLNNRKKY